MKNPKDKVTVYFEGVDIQTTFELLQKQDDYDEQDDGTYIVYLTDGRLEQACELEPEGFFTETRLYEYDSGYMLCIDSNYKLSKKEQEKVESYYESDDPYSCYLSSWRCYYDKKDNQIFEKKLINIIDQEEKVIYDAGGDHYSVHGLTLQRLDPSDFLKDFKYYWE